MSNEVVITGLGCISPVGNDPDQAWANVQAGNSGIAPITHYDTEDFKIKIAGEVKGFSGKALFGNKKVRKMDLFTQFAMASTIQAIADAGLEITDNNRDRIGIIIGTGIGGIGTLSAQYDVMHERGSTRVSPFLIPMMLPDAAAGAIAIELGLRGPNMAVVTACATGTNAVGESAAIITRGDADVVIAGGAEAAIAPIAMAGLSVMNAMSTRFEDPTTASRPFDRTRDGFVMGEGAAVLVMESKAHAVARGARILAEVSGYGTTNDAFHITSPAENGAGAARCMTIALADAGIAPQDIGYINAHGTSTPLNDKSETAAIKTVFGEHAYDTPISSTKSMTGHLLGASGALEAMFCIKALGSKVLPPTINYSNADPECDLDYVPNQARSVDQLTHTMSNSFGFGGHNATIILSRPQENGL